MGINTTQIRKSTRGSEYQPGHGLLEVEFGVGNVPFAWLVALQEALCAQHCVLHAYAYSKFIHFFGSYATCFTWQSQDENVRQLSCSAWINVCTCWKL